MTEKKVELGDGEPSPPLAEAKELFELYLGVSKSSDVNTYVDWYKRVNDWLKRNSGAAQEVSPPATCKSCRTVLYRTLGEKGEYCDRCESKEEVSPPRLEILAHRDKMIELYMTKFEKAEGDTRELKAALTEFIANVRKYKNGWMSAVVLEEEIASTERLLSEPPSAVK